MIIGIDGNEANEVRGDIGARVGVNSYAFEILWGLYKLRTEKDLHKYVIYLKNTPTGLPPGDKNWKYKIIPGGGFWIIKKLMPSLFTSPRPTVFFSPSHYLPPVTLMPKVCTIHDLGYLKFSEHLKKYDFWQLKYWTAISATISKYIISVSESTKKDIVRHYPYTSKKVFVVHHGYDKLKFNSEINNNDVRRVLNKYSIPPRYILFLSTLKPSKNVEGLLKAYQLLKIMHKNNLPSLVIAGKKGWQYNSIFKITKRLKLGKSVIFTDFVLEKDKPALFFGAKVFVLPSFWEGFGLDILHSLACGTPVVTSKVASMPEVAGKAGIYIDPNKPESIAKGMKNVLSLGKKEYNSLVKRGYVQARKFSWERTAKQTLGVLEKASHVE